MRKRKIRIWVGLTVLTGILSACGTKDAWQEVTVEAIPEEQAAAESKTQEVLPETEGDDYGIYSYLTGLPVEENQQDQRPIAVMMNNIKEGCPQTGIEKASVIYEAPVEGRITRLMGIFENWEDIEKIGYIRSSRDYFVYCALEHDAIYCHFGQATPYVGDLLNSDRVDNISAAVAGIDRPAPHAFHRVNERPAPHNVVTDGKDIMEDVKKFNYSLTYHGSFKSKFIFKKNGIQELYQDEPDCSVIFPGGETGDKANGYSHIRARFEYRDGKYYRYEYGGPQIDEETGNQLSYENVVLQYCNGEVRDKNDYLIFGCHGDTGFPVQVFTQGKVISGTWTRHSDNDPAIYVDEDGKRIQLTPGKSWICLIWMDYAEDVVLK